MPALASDLRRQLENVIVQARDAAEAAARSALTKLAVDAAEPFDHFDARQRDRRNRLRARGRQAGDVRQTNATQSVEQLTGELAYEYWHRMLFARFLAENNLLMHPDGVPVSLDDCKELAPGEGAADEYVLAARYAGRMLPQIFRTDDVLLEVEFAPEQRLALERLLAGLPCETFLADDSLGWVYQFWQTDEKERVNRSGEKIDGHTLPAVTQLFTEHYMVQFLLHNTLGAWWCGRNGIKGPVGGAGLATGGCQPPGIPDMKYLRWADGGTPAAGTFPGWPKTLAEFTLLDPCCGSGHFLVAAFNLLVPLRMHDEGLSAADACDAVLKENLFGLELDPRCTQIAAFALALAAWKYPDAGGYRILPELNVACCGQAAVGALCDWENLATGTSNGFAIAELYHLFQKAGDLGSLIDTSVFRNNPLFRDTFVDVRSTLASLFRRDTRDADARAMTVAAQGIARAADILSDRYTLVATNVPYLGRSRQAYGITKHLDDKYPLGKADLATAFVLRCQELCGEGGSTALVTPHTWLFLGRYKKLREMLLKERTWNIIARLGPRAFETISGEVVNVALLVMSNLRPTGNTTMVNLDVSDVKTAAEKATGLADGDPVRTQMGKQADQLRNPDAKIALGGRQEMTLLSNYATAPRGVVTGDNAYWVRMFWEFSVLGSSWRRLQSAVNLTLHFGGRETVVNWQTEGVGMLRPGVANTSYKKYGVAVSQVGDLPATLYTGEIYDNSTFAIVPRSPEYVLPIWAYCSSDQYCLAVRHFNQKLSVDPSHLVQVPFDLAHWQAVAAERYPNGLPEPHSDDPTQWLFKGDLATSTDPLQVAVARLLGYRWPDQPAGPDAVDRLADDDGIVCLPGVREEAPAAERLRDVLIAGYGEAWSESLLTKLLTDAGGKAGATLYDWLAGSFFDLHCKRFGQRPFVWHVWDGRKDGFSALLNYHKLNHKTLENLTYSYLGDWLTTQTAEARAGKVGADLRLAAAGALQEKLKLILAGEPPYDIFVRWKPLSEQPIGWNPDLNDGVRQNIRPFVKAGVLRKDLKGILKDKDRGNEPQRDKAEYPWFWTGDKPSTERVNDVHLTTAEKQAARDKLKPKGARP